MAQWFCLTGHSVPKSCRPRPEFGHSKSDIPDRPHRTSPRPEALRPGPGARCSAGCRSQPTAGPPDRSARYGWDTAPHLSSPRSAGRYSQSCPPTARYAPPHSRKSVHRRTPAVRRCPTAKNTRRVLGPVRAARRAVRSPAAGRRQRQNRIVPLSAAHRPLSKIFAWLAPFSMACGRFPHVPHLCRRNHFTCNFIVMVAW